MKVAGGFTAALAASLFIQVFAAARLGELASVDERGERFRRLLFVPLATFVVGLLLTRFALGGREAVMLGGLRVHLPTLLLPFVLLWTSLLVWYSESASEGREARLILSAAAGFFVVLLYRLCSSDNGGTAVMAVGVLAVLWLGCSRKKLAAALTAAALAGLLFFAWLNQPVRFELAWGDEEGRVLYYDEAKNLRLARDMARAGTFAGNFTGLRVPAEMRSTLHNDLAVAYLIGFFGWAVFAVVFVAYAFFYNYLFRALSGALFASDRRARPPGPAPYGAVRVRPLPGGPAPDAEPADEPPRDKSPRQLLLIFSGALVLAFMSQTLWVMVATLLSLVPFTGLDFQPVSASSISIVSFFVVLLGSAALTFTLNRTLHE